MVKIEYKGKNLIKIEKDIKKILNELKRIFSVDVSKITIYIYDNRNEFNKKLKKETAEWLVANASDNNEIDILSPLAMEKESSHDKKEFLQILKHEFTHLFVHELSKSNTVPKWLNEGLASYIAGQHKDKQSGIYIDKDFCKKLSTTKGWNENVNYFAYDIAYLFVNFLIKKYSFKKIMKLICSLDSIYYHDSFKKTFKSIYKKDLKEVEELFIEKINK